MAAEKTQSGAFQDSHTSTHDKEYAYKEEVFELSRDRTAAKNLANALPSKKENPCDTKQPLIPKQSYLSKHDLQSISYHIKPWFYVERKCRKASICQPLNSTLA